MVSDEWGERGPTTFKPHTSTKSTPIPPVTDCACWRLHQPIVPAAAVAMDKLAAALRAAAQAAQLARGGGGGGGGVAGAASGAITAIHARLAGARVTGAAGGGFVRVTMTGLRECVKVEVDPALIAAGKAAVVEDLCRAAVNDALRQVAEAEVSEGASLLGALPSLLSSFTGGGGGGGSTNGGGTGTSGGSGGGRLQ